MQESEAKKKWCPHIRTRQNGMNALAVNVFNNEDRPTCIGTACMMWDSFEYEARIFKGHDRSYEIEIKNVGQGDCGLKVGTLEIG